MPFRNQNIFWELSSMSTFISLEDNLKRSCQLRFFSMLGCTKSWFHRVIYRPKNIQEQKFLLAALFYTTEKITWSLSLSVQVRTSSFQSKSWRRIPPWPGKHIDKNYAFFIKRFCLHFPWSSFTREHSHILKTIRCRPWSDKEKCT